MCELYRRSATADRPQPLRSYLYTLVVRKMGDIGYAEPSADSERVVTTPAMTPATTADSSATGIIAETPIEDMAATTPSPRGAPTHPTATPAAAP